MDNTEVSENVEISFDFTKRTWRDDVTFLVENQRLYATKAILAIASPVFEAMFGSEFREKSQEEIPLPDKKFRDFNEFLHCIYPNSKKKVQAQNVYRILPLADEYNVKPLIRECMRFLSNRMTKDLVTNKEVVYCHGLAARHCFKSLREDCATRLARAGIKVLDAISVSDADTLLEMHKDILKKQGDVLEETRTELVNMYLHRNVRVEPSVNFLEERGSIIKFKQNLKSVEGIPRRCSDPVKLWDMDFHSLISVSKEGDKSCISFHITARFPENTANITCKVFANIFVDLYQQNKRSYNFRIDWQEFTKTSNTWGFTDFAQSVEQSFKEGDFIDVVTYLMVKKPVVRNS